jgi:hypothetical protein
MAKPKPTPELTKYGQKLLAYVEHLRELMRQQEVLLAELEMQARLALQGIHPNHVAAWGYDDRTDDALALRRRQLLTLRKLPLPGVYNYVKLHDGTRVDIEPVPKPPPRDWAETDSPKEDPRGQEDPKDPDR